MNIKAYLKEDNLQLVHSLSENRISKIKLKKQNIENDYLSGNISTYTYDGFCCIEYDFDIIEDCHERIIIDSEFIQISFAINGKSLVIKEDKTVKMQSGCINLAYLNKHTVDIKMLKEEKKVNHIRLILSKQFFINLMTQMGWSISESFIDKILNKQYISFGNVEISTEMEIITTLRSIFFNDYPHPIDNIFLKNKISEILIRIHYLFENKENFTKITPTESSEIERLEQAKVYLEAHYNESITINELSKKVYINEFKLKKGFKQIFGCTIHEYLTNVRMQKAKEFLMNDLQVSEIASSLGYKTSSHFIQAFKKYFGHTPKQLKVIIAFMFQEVLLCI